MPMSLSHNSHLFNVVRCRVQGETAQGTDPVIQESVSTMSRASLPRIDCHACAVDLQAMRNWREGGGEMPVTTCKGHVGFCKSHEGLALRVTESECDECWAVGERARLRIL
jgi:hypothetical protein